MVLLLFCFQQRHRILCKGKQYLPVGKVRQAISLGPHRYNSFHYAMSIFLFPFWMEVKLLHVFCVTQRHYPNYCGSFLLIFQMSRSNNCFIIDFYINNFVISTNSKFKTRHNINFNINNLTNWKFEIRHDHDELGEWIWKWTIYLSHPRFQFVMVKLIKHM